MPPIEEDELLIIIDTAVEVREFMRIVARTKHDPLVTNTVLDELLNVAHWQNTAKEELDIYVSDIKRGVHLFEMDTSYKCLDVRPEIADAVKDLGEALLGKLDALDIYDETGRLCFDVYSSPNEDSYEKVNEDIILIQRFREDFIN